MLKKITIVLAGLALYGCTDPANNSNAGSNDVNNAKTGQTGKDKSPAAGVKGNLNFLGPQQIDNSSVVMYQLDFAEKDQSSGSGFISKSDRRSAYWNIIFLNTETHQYHLLDSTRKMRILSVNADREADEVIPRTQQVKSNFIFYLIAIDDLNKDGQLDDDDPDYLFISDKSGNNLKQISPVGYDVRSWKLISETNKILIEAVVAKTEKDDERESVPFIYDLAGSAPPQQTFAPDFINKTKVLYNRQWRVKK